ncbi:ribonuclease Y [Sesbania bispinosa]|nr:ribonuclease Y [Sesbania bispinosa]
MMIEVIACAPEAPLIVDLAHHNAATIVRTALDLLENELKGDTRREEFEQKKHQNAKITPKKKKAVKEKFRDIEGDEDLQTIVKIRQSEAPTKNTELRQSKEVQTNVLGHSKEPQKALEGLTTTTNIPSSNLEG